MKSIKNRMGVVLSMALALSVITASPALTVHATEAQATQQATVQATQQATVQSDYQQYVTDLVQKTNYALQTRDVSAFTPSDEVLAKYYKNKVDKSQAAYAEAQCALWAVTALSQNGTTDLDRVKAAAKLVADRAKQITYGTDNKGYYQTPYGIIRANVYTCAGTVRTLGRVLDYMGYSWQHVNEGQYSHQWIILNMDGQVGFADSMTGLCGYGEMRPGMQVDGWTLYY